MRSRTGCGHLSRIVQQHVTLRWQMLLYPLHRGSLLVPTAGPGNISYGSVHSATSCAEDGDIRKKQAGGVMCSVPGLRLTSHRRLSLSLLPWNSVGCLVCGSSWLRLDCVCLLLACLLVFGCCLGCCGCAAVASVAALLSSLRCCVLLSSALCVFFCLCLLLLLVVSWPRRLRPPRATCHVPLATCLVPRATCTPLD